MRHKNYFSSLILISLLAFGMSANAQEAPENMIKITSPVFNSEERIPTKYTCDGSNARPTIQFSDIPEGAQSLVVIVDDPDAPAGNFNHWIMWNINPSVGEIGENEIPSGAVSGTNSAERTGYIGPCPPSGTHRYIFKVFALNSTLDLPETSRKADLENAMQGKIIEQGELVGKYSRMVNNERLKNPANTGFFLV